MTLLVAKYDFHNRQASFQTSLLDYPTRIFKLEKMADTNDPKQTSSAVEDEDEPDEW